MMLLPLLLVVVVVLVEGGDGFPWESGEGKEPPGTFACAMMTKFAHPPRDETSDEMKSVRSVAADNKA